jgi:hypothetical protein
MRHAWLATTTGLTVLVMAACSRAGLIVDFPEIRGPVGTADGQSITSTDPNNDNVESSQNVLEFGTVSFLASQPIDVAVAVVNSGGTSEYQATLGQAVNDTGDTWIGFRLILGQGLEDDFAPFTASFPDSDFDDTIDWDDPDQDRAPSSPQFPTLIRYEPFVLEAGGGIVGPGEFAEGQNLNLDIPDAASGSPYPFTIRLQPIVIPEPSPLMPLTVMAAVGLAGSRWGRFRPRSGSPGRWVPGRA